MSVSRRVIHHGLYFAVLGPLIGVLFLVLYIFFAKEPLILLVIIQVLPLFILLSITTGAIPAMLTDAPRDKCTLSCAINGIHAAFHYLKKNYISGCVMTVPTG